MKASVLRSIPLFPVLLLLVLFMPQGIQTAEASQDLQAGYSSHELHAASEYYYFKSPSDGDTFKPGEEIPVSFYAGVVQKTTIYSGGMPLYVRYATMPVTFKVLKDNKEIYSKEFTYEQGTTIETTYKPTTSGTLTFQIYGRNMGLGLIEQVLQDTITITVRGASDVKNETPAITVNRLSKKAAEITCSNEGDYGMKVYRADIKNGKYKLIGSSAGLTYRDKKITMDKSYYYKVRLTAKDGKKTYLSKWSDVACVPSIQTTKPVIAVERTSKKTAEITCENSGGFNMEVYRAAKKNGKYKLLATTSKSTFTDKKLSAGKVYYYVVRLNAKSGKRILYSKPSAAKVAGKHQPPVSLSYTPSKGVKVSWKATDGAGYYLVSRNTTGENDAYEVISCEDGSSTTFYDKDVEKGKTYYYAVSAWRGDDEVLAKHISNAYKITVK